MFAGSISSETPFQRRVQRGKRASRICGLEIRGKAPTSRCSAAPEVRSPGRVHCRSTKAGDRHLHRRGQGLGVPVTRHGHRLELDRRGDRDLPARPAGRAPDAAMLSCAHDNKLTKKGLFQHFRTSPRASTFQSCSTHGPRVPAATCRRRPSSSALSQVQGTHRHQGTSYTDRPPRRDHQKGKEGIHPASGEDLPARWVHGAGRDG